MTDLAAECCAQLDEAGVTYTRYDHPPVYTSEEGMRAVPADLTAVHVKNLFLRDKKGLRHFLVLTVPEKSPDLARLAPLIGGDRLSFGSPDRLQRVLGVTPGAVTPLALLHDAAHQVELVIDRDVWAAESICCHPMVNTATLVLSHAGLERVLERTGHRPRLIDVPTRDASPAAG